MSPPNDAVKKTVSPSELELAAERELVKAARERGVALTGPGVAEGADQDLLETALEEEMGEHLGCDKHAVQGRTPAGAIRCIAAHSDSSDGRCATIATARAFNSAGYRFVVFPGTTPTSQALESPDMPGRFWPQWGEIPVVWWAVEGFVRVDACSQAGRLPLRARDRSFGVGQSALQRDSKVAHRPLTDLGPRWRRMARAEHEVSLRRRLEVWLFSPQLPALLSVGPSA